MELYTLDRKFVRQNIIDPFHSVIWTERYYGDSEIELVVPATAEMINILPKGTFVALDKADEVMILETILLEEGKMKISGISLLPWMNNRFVRTSNNHREQSWPLSGGPAGWALWAIIFYMCCNGSPYLNGSINTGIPEPQQLIIPGLWLKDYDKSGEHIVIDVPYGPVYDAMREIAEAYQIGMQITLDSVTDTSYTLGFRSYKGLDRTSSQNVNPVVRFSPQMDSLTDIKELQSLAALKTLVYTFASGLAEEEPLATTTPPGIAREMVFTTSGSGRTGFDLRALMVLVDQITSETITVVEDGDPDPQVLRDLLRNRAELELKENRLIVTVDGEIVPTSQFKYGVDYTLGDLIEMQGNSGAIQPARVTEYIRSQDSTGERAFPTVEIV